MKPGEAGADELFNFVFQTIYLRGAPKAPTVCFRNRCLGNYTIREREAGRETTSAGIGSNKLWDNTVPVGCTASVRPVARLT